MGAVVFRRLLWLVLYTRQPKVRSLGYFTLLATKSVPSSRKRWRDAYMALVCMSTTRFYEQQAHSLYLCTSAVRFYEHLTFIQCVSSVLFLFAPSCIQEIFRFLFTYFSASALHRP